MKTTQLQIRVSEAQKALLRAHAERAGLSMSEWVLRRALPPLGERFQELVARIAAGEAGRFAWAELHDFLAPLAGEELELALAEAPRAELGAYPANYLAALVEHAAAAKGARAPAWTARVRPLDEPVFGAPLESLRLHLLTRAPLAFRRRNIFVDSSVGDRV